MLPAAQRLRSKDEFHRTIRSGVRAGRRNLVLYAFVVPREHASAVKAGFIVSKAVGNAVSRNKVKRRLRALTWQHQNSLPADSLLVVRALPAAKDADFTQLAADFGSAAAALVRKLKGGGVDHPDHGRSASQPTGVVPATHVSNAQRERGELGHD